MNFLRATMHEVDEDVIRVLSSPGLDKTREEQEDAMEFLKKNHYIVENYREDEALLEDLYRKESATWRKIAVCIAIPSYDCQLKCVYCFRRLRSDIKNDSQTRKLPIDLFCAALDKLFDQEGIMSSQLSLTGGEPLLPKNEEIISSILHEAAKRKMNLLSITTNGVDMDTYLPLLKKYRIPVKVSLDGPQRIHDKRRIRRDGSGTFQSIVQNIEEARKHINIVLKFNADSQNIKYLPEFADFVVSRGWHEDKHFSFVVSTIKFVSSEYPYFLKWYDMLEKLMELHRKFPSTRLFNFYNTFTNFFDSWLKLSASRKFETRDNLLSVNCCYTPYGFVFDPEGIIYSCTVLQHEIGRYSPTFELYGEERQRMRDRNVATIEQCRRCKYGLLCGSGCAYEASQTTGSFENPMCPLPRDTMDSWVNSYLRFLYEMRGTWREGIPHERHE
ncbi:MAG: radical SAM protein [Candidatus Methanofastidiosia archaeon]